jgi:hypothetical protein
LFFPDPDLVFLFIPDQIQGVKKVPDPDPQHGWWVKKKRIKMIFIFQIETAVAPTGELGPASRGH